MFQVKQILVPVDFSPSSWLALEEAAMLARTYDAAVDVLYVWQVPMLVHPEELATSGLPSTVIDAVSDNAVKQLDLFKNEALAKNIVIRKAQTFAGAPYETIVATAEQGDYDLIVIGTHGRKALSRLLLGSVAERVVRHATCPVLVARNKPGKAAK